MSLTHVLDSDITAYLMNGRYRELSRYFAETSPDDVGITSVTLAELLYGALHSQRPVENHQRVNDFISSMTILPFATDAAHQFASIKEHLTRAGRLIGHYDLMIAAIALANDVTLVTNNTREFSRVPGLRIENWLESL